MAAPIAVARGYPNFPPMHEGFPVLVGILGFTTLCFWEIDVKPPAMDGLEPMDITTQHNALVHTMFPRYLEKYDPITVMCAYPSKAYEDIHAHLNVIINMCITFPDSDQLAFFGFIQKFEPEALKEGDFPKANMTIVLANIDPQNAYVEAPPVYIPVIGT